MGRLKVILIATVCFGMAGGTYMLTIHQPTQTMQQAELIEGTVQSTDVAVTENSHAPVVTYQYRFGGQIYTNDRIELIGGGPGFETSSRAEEYLRSYTVGDQVTVHVVPQNPSTSFLRRGSPGLLVYGVIASLGFMGFLSIFAFTADLLGAEYVDIK